MAAGTGAVRAGEIPGAEQEGVCAGTECSGMNKMVQSLWYGIGSFLPGILFLIALVAAFIMMQQEGDISARYGLSLVLFVFLMVVLCWFYIITMMVDAANHCEGNEKIIWIILLYLINIFVFPVYWFVCVRKRTNHF